MKRFGLASLIALGASALTFAGCGDDDDGPEADALVLPADGGMGMPDAPSGNPDAMVQRGEVEDFFDPLDRVCNVDNDCANPVSHCRPIGLWQGSPKQCIPACADSDECPLDTVCYHSNDSTLVFMKDHCYISLCGPLVMNGTTGGACTLGADISNPADESFAGWCYPFIDGQYGQCIEVGDVPQGGVCDFGERTRDGANCDATSLCVGQQGNPDGTCAQICDPAQILTGTDTCTTAGEDCFDSSSHTGMDRTMRRQTIGFCLDGITSCSLIAANTCPADPMTGDAQGCATTNALRPTGICDKGATGALAIDDTCFDMPTGDAQECVHGSLCYGATPACQQACDIGAATPVVTCGTGTCTMVVFGPGYDNMSGTPDDEYTADWGLCQ